MKNTGFSDNMKYSQIIGIISALTFAFSGLLRWTWYPDIQEYFTGFYTYNNTYGRPGMAFIFFSAISIIFFLLPRIWAKRGNVFLCAIALSFSIRTFIVFSGCYRGLCPEKQFGIWLMLAAAASMMVAALLPDIKLKKDTIGKA